MSAVVQSTVVSTVGEPLVSIIIPCYNGEHFVGEAIESALTQTYRHKEVIAIDDGSTDRSLEVIKSFGRRIQWNTGCSKGGGAARNGGLVLANGEFVQFLDADDVLFPNKLARQVPIAQLRALSLTYTDHQCRWVDDGGALEIRSMCVMDPDPLVFILRHKTLHTSGPLYRREWLLDIGGFRAGLPRSQEFEMNLRLAAYLGFRGGTVVHIPGVHFEVRRRHGSVSSNTASTYAVKADYLPDIVADLEARGQLDRHRRTELAVYSAGIGRHCLKGGETGAGLRLIELAGRLDRKSAEQMAWGTCSRFVKRLLGPLAVERLSRIGSRFRRRRSVVS